METTTPTAPEYTITHRPVKSSLKNLNQETTTDDEQIVDSNNKFNTLRASENVSNGSSRSSRKERGTGSGNGKAVSFGGGSLIAFASQAFAASEPVWILLAAIVVALLNVIEKFLGVLMNIYDDYVYSPLQKTLSPWCKRVPRDIQLFDGGMRIPVFTANLITLSRTFLVVPVAWFLKYDYNWLALWCVVFHDFLDHLDGIVAKVQKHTYPQHDDPLLGGFLDAFCDKIVNVLCTWSVLQMVKLDETTIFQSFVFLFVCYGVIAYESVIGIVRVQDFFLAKFKRDFNLVIIEKDTTTPPYSSSSPQQISKERKASVDLQQQQQEGSGLLLSGTSPSSSTGNNKQSTGGPSPSVSAATMEGKLKEKLESTGIALLCVAIGNSYSNPITNGFGISGLICLGLTLRMAHKSLIIKLNARSPSKGKSSTIISSQHSSSSHSSNNYTIASTALTHNTTTPRFSRSNSKNNNIHQDQEVDAKLKRNPSVDNLLMNLLNSEENRSEETEHPQFEKAEMKMVDYQDNKIVESGDEDEDDDDGTKQNADGKDHKENKEREGSDQQNTDQESSNARRGGVGDSLGGGGENSNNQNNNKKKTGSHHSHMFSYKKRRQFYLEDQLESPEKANNQGGVDGYYSDSGDTELATASLHAKELAKELREDAKTMRQSAEIRQSTSMDLISSSLGNPSTMGSGAFSGGDVSVRKHRVDKIYTIGCFDLFHKGHVRLIQRMRTMGKKVIVGVHDSRSIYKLKNRVPVDSTEKRMLNVKTAADEVFCIANTDPSNFISCIVNLGKKETALYVRGDDMKNFPSRELVESLMPIKFLPYTQGVSSTQIRKEKFGHIAADDEGYLDTNN